MKRPRRRVRDMATENLFPEYPVSYRGPFVRPRGRFAWWHRLSLQYRRRHRMWQVRDGRNDVVADVYTDEFDARLIAAAPRLARALKILVTTSHPDHPGRAAAMAEAQAILREVAA